MYMTLTFVSNFLNMLNQLSIARNIIINIILLYLCACHYYTMLCFPRTQVMSVCSFLLFILN